jgi:predicted CoA-binding protein
MSVQDLISSMLTARRIAVVGVSQESWKPSHAIAQYLINAGYEVLPVNPNLTTVLGLRCYASLDQIPVPIDLVNIFRRPEFIPEIVTQAIAANAGGIWIQSGLRSPAAAQLAKTARLLYIEDRCIMVEHAKRR